MTERVLVSVSIGAAVGGAAGAAAIGLLAGIARGARGWIARRGSWPSRRVRASR